MESNNSKELRTRKMLLILPALMIPFLILFFWAMGGGKTASAQAADNKSGINVNLPGAHFKQEGQQDKLSFYDRAQKDSSKLKALMQNDPYYNNAVIEPFSIDTGTHSSSMAKPVYLTAAQQNEQKIYNKLAALNHTINNPVTGYQMPSEPAYNSPTPSASAMSSGDIDRLEQMMKTMKEPSPQDPELDQLNGMMDKVLDMQHPERVNQRLKAQSEKYKQRALPVTQNASTNNITLLDAASTPKFSPSESKRFYALDDAVPGDENQNAIEAVIQETKTLTDGATVKLRLLGDVYISGVLIVQGTFIYGRASLSGERLVIAIASVRSGNNILPVALSVYDMDGVQGIYIPGAITRDVAKQSADQSIQNMGLATFDPSIGAQAASAAVTTAKSLLSKKVKLVKVTVKEGYKVLLRDENQRNQ